MLATLNHHDNIIKYLVSFEARIVNKLGETALMLAVRNKCYDEAELLVKAEGNVVRNSRVSALLIAVELHD